MKDRYLEVVNGKLKPCFAPRIVVNHEFNRYSAWLIPKWYGVAYTHYDLSATVMWIIPLNIIAGWLHTLRGYLKRGLKPDAIARLCHTNYERGIEEGRRREGVELADEFLKLAELDKSGTGRE